MIPSHNYSKPVVKLVYSPESRDDALLANKTIWSCTAPVAIINVASLVLTITLISQGNWFGGIFSFFALMMTSLILFFAIPAEIKARRHEKYTELRSKLMRFIIANAHVGAVSKKQVNQLLTGHVVNIKNFTFLPFEKDGVAGIAVSEAPEPAPKLTEEQEYARLRKQYPEAEIIT